MADIYLCGNRSSTATDITLRGVNPCAVASTSRGAMVAPARHLPPRRRPIPRRAGSLSYELVLFGSGTIVAPGAEIVLRGQLAGGGQIHANGNHLLSLASTGTGLARTEASMTLRASLAQLHDDEDELLALFDIVT